MKCLNCGNKLVQKQGNKIKLRVKGKIEFVDDMCLSNCYWCGAPVNFYFPLGDMSNIEGIRYVVRN